MKLTTPSVLTRLNKRYFEILSKLVPGDIEFAICDADDLLVLSSLDNSAFSLNATPLFVRGEYQEISGGERNTLKLELNDGRTVYKTSICSSSSDRIGSLYAVLAPPRQKAAPPKQNSVTNYEQILAESLDVVVFLLEKECRLKQELEAMAEELIERYEELNLIYDSEDEIKSYVREGQALNSLIEHCLDHLALEMVALVLPDQDKVFCTTSSDSGISNPYEMIQHLQPALLPSFDSSRDNLIINDLSDSRREKFGIDILHKLLSCSVTDNQGDLLGYLVCLSSSDGKDFLNSDKNLLHVVARKISKILQANYDSLTRLMNKRALESLVHRSLEVAREKGVFNCLLYIDLDQLEVVNQVCGREAGDYVIQFSGNLLRDNLRHTDSLGYLGDGKYGVLLEHCDMKQGARVAENLRKLVERAKYSWASQALETSVTIGVSLIEPHSRDVDVVLEAAEIALRSAKEQGKNKIQVYHQDDSDLASRKEKMYWVNRVQSALRENQFILFAQTIKPVKNLPEKYHLEVLLRLANEDSTLVSPFKFLPAAEQYGLMPQIDRWVIHETFSLLAEKRLANSPDEGIVSINLSGQSLTDAGLLHYITTNSRQYDVEPSCICFEITETAAIHNIKNAHELLNDLKKLEYKFSLDDFGTGLSSFTYLQTLPVDTLKIDGSFVRHITTDKVSHAMVTSINQIGHVMDLTTVAEFVENDAIRAELEKIGVDYLQGYGIHEPSPLDAYLDSLIETRTGTG